jgi:hypothetical protein
MDLHHESRPVRQGFQQVGDHGQGFFTGVALRHGVQQRHFREPKLAIFIEMSVQSHGVGGSFGTSKHRLRQCVVHLGITWNSFFPLAIGPDIMLPSVAQECPAKLAEGSLQVSSFHGFVCTRICVHCQELQALSHLTLGMNCCRKRERGTSGRCRQSVPCPC